MNCGCGCNSTTPFFITKEEYLAFLSGLKGVTIEETSCNFDFELHQQLASNYVNYIVKKCTSEDVTKNLICWWIYYSQNFQNSGMTGQLFANEQVNSMAINMRVMVV